MKHQCRKTLIDFAEWLEYNGKWMLPHEQVEAYISQHPSTVLTKDGIDMNEPLKVVGNTTGHEVAEGDVVRVKQKTGYYDDIEIEDNGVMCIDDNGWVWFIALCDLEKIRH